MFNNPPIIKTDALRRGTAMRPAPAAPSQPTGGLSQTPQAGLAQMMQALQQHPGMTPEMLRMLLEDQRQKMAAKPILSPSDMVGGANYRNPL